MHLVPTTQLQSLLMPKQIEYKMANQIPDILTLLPHRPPFLLVDEILSLSSDQVVTRTIFGNDHIFFEGHFPGEPVLPGVVLTEAMAQTILILHRYLYPSTSPMYMASVQAKFLQPVFPNTAVVFTAEPVKFLKEKGIGKAQAAIGEKIVATCKIGFGCPDIKIPMDDHQP